MTESGPLVRQPEVSRAGHRGQGTYVAVLDTGVDAARYPGFFPAGSLASNYSALDAYAGNANGSALSYGHGTHVASTVLAMAPATRIISVDVFRWETGTDGPQWSAGRLKDGLRHITNLKAAYLRDPSQCCNVVAANLSLGQTNKWFDESCADGLFTAAWAVGIIPVVSSGNNARMYDFNLRSATGPHRARHLVSGMHPRSAVGGCHLRRDLRR